MYFCLSIKDGEYNVLDTTDNIVETFSEEDIISYLSSGISIYGVTEESISLSCGTCVLVEYPSRNVDCGTMFNGYYFQSYTSTNYDDLHNPYLYSVVPSLSEDELIGIIPYIQQINIGIFHHISSLYNTVQVGYEVSAVFDNGLFNAIDISTGDEYGFSYCEFCSTLCFDYLRVDRDVYIDNEKLVFDNKEFSLRDAISYNLSDLEKTVGYYCEQVNCSSSCIDSLSLHSSGVREFLSVYGDKYLTDTYFPMVCLFDYKKDEPLFDSHFLKEWSNLSSNISLDRLTDIIRAKRRLLYGEMYDLKSFRVNHDYINKGAWVGIEPSLSSKPCFDSHNTDFGIVATATYIRRDFESRLIDGIDGLSLYHVTHTGSIYYRIGRSGYTIRMSRANMKYNAKVVAGETFIDYLDKYRDYLGYYYNRPNIVPLFVHNVIEHDDGVEINIVVAVNNRNGKSFIPQRSVKSNERDYSWGAMFFVVPLLLTGTRHYTRNDVVVFDMLFQELVISLNVYNNLVVNIDEFNDLICIDKCSEVSSLKYCNCEINSKDSTKNVSTIKRILKSDMTEVMHFLAEGDYCE